MSQSGESGQPICVGIVEDDVTLGRLIDRALEQRGHRVWRCETIAKAIERIVLDPPQILLLDLALPDGDGWQVLAQIQNRPPVIRVVVMSSQRVSRAEHARFCLAGYLAKPVAIEAVVATVESHLSVNTSTSHRSIHG